MTETAMGILARTPEDERAGACDVALSSGVVEFIRVLDALQPGWWHIVDTKFLVARFQ